MQTTQQGTATLPTITLPTFRALVDRLQAERPESAARIERGGNIVLNARQIRETGEAGVYHVQSCQRPDVWYCVTTAGCTCVDANRAPRGYCKHQASVELLVQASVVASREARERAAYESIPHVLTDEVEAVLTTSYGVVSSW